MAFFKGRTRLQYVVFSRALRVKQELCPARCRSSGCLRFQCSRRRAIRLRDWRRAAIEFRFFLSACEGFGEFLNPAGSCSSLSQAFSSRHVCSMSCDRGLKSSESHPKHKNS